jgi:hypothetical protein
MRNTYVISFIICFLVLNPSIFLNAQSGWTEDMRLTYRQGASMDPKAACNGDTIYLVWWEHYWDSLTVLEEVFYKRSTDAGETWGDDVMLSVEDTQSSTMPQVAVWGNVVHVIWFEDDFGLLYRRSMDGGESWESIDSIVPGMTYSSICAIGDTVYIAGTIGSLGVLRFTKSYDGGNNWQPIIEITRASSSPRIRSISADVFSLIISYAKGGSPVCTEVFQVLSYDGGQTWLDSIMVSQNDSVAGQRPAMDTDDSSGIHITWYDYKYSPYAWTGDIFYRASRDSGNTWEEIDSLTVQHRAVASDILAEDNNLHLVWEDDRHGFNNNFETYYRMSIDLGQTWENEVRLTDAPEWSRSPSLTSSGSKFLHLFWSDQRDDPVNRTDEIYYKRKNLTGIDETNKFRFYSPDLSLNCSTILTRNSFIYYNLGDYKKAEILIMDVTGRVVDNFPVHQVSGYFVLSSNKEVCDGVYFIMLRAEEEYTTKKVVVVK